MFKSPDKHGEYCLLPTPTAYCLFRISYVRIPCPCSTVIHNLPHFSPLFATFSTFSPIIVGFLHFASVSTASSVLPRGACSLGGAGVGERFESVVQGH